MEDLFRPFLQFLVRLAKCLWLNSQGIISSPIDRSWMLTAMNDHLGISARTAMRLNSIARLYFRAEERGCFVFSTVMLYLLMLLVMFAFIAKLVDRMEALAGQESGMYVNRKIRWWEKAALWASWIILWPFR